MYTARIEEVHVPPLWKEALRLTYWILLLVCVVFTGIRTAWFMAAEDTARAILNLGILIFLALPIQTSFVVNRLKSHMRMLAELSMSATVNAILAEDEPTDYVYAPDENPEDFQ